MVEGRAWPSRRALALVTLLAVAVGAVVYLLVVPNAAGEGASRQVALVDQSGSATATKLAGKLAGGDGFDWENVSAEQAEAGLSNGSYLAAVTVPAGYGVAVGKAGADKPAPAGSPADQQVSVAFSSRADQSSATTLAQQISAAVTDVGVGNLMVAVNSSRTTLSAAGMSAGLIKGVAGQADGAVGELTAQADQLTGQLRVALDGSKLLLDGANQAGAAIGDATRQMDTLADGLGGTQVSIGQIRDGAKSLGDGIDAELTRLRQVQAVQAQVARTLGAVAGQLRTTGDPAAVGAADSVGRAAQVLTEQGMTPATIDGLVKVGDGSRALAGQLDSTSSILGMPVRPDTDIADLLRGGAGQLRQMGGLLQQGAEQMNQGLRQASTQVDAQLPQLQDGLERGLAQFRTVTAQLSADLTKGTAGLPTLTAAQRSTFTPAVAEAPSTATDGTTAAEVGAVLGAAVGTLVLGVAGAAWWARRRSRPAVVDVG
ncbi:hypothetical protein G4X40_07990 [Rhodococcus sp. D2-41]|uniref:DUF3533 domain-containing protein n=1 Tax=Speluncibacter jeojiensis TaxID=2710754 RepID=A0A9X4RE88_9ACTN|nr:hypothetical protein [Rhodococcus sp. D2-41]MDG3010089.1 hypothetical protein [Rhodococcus sp. D2-41]MDG3015635.1 hypothetical protein [Corynebacteriales bacterium D3-21]